MSTRRLCLILTVGLALAWAGSALAITSVPLETYGRSPAVEAVTLSPSGQRMAMIATTGGQKRLVVTTVDSDPVMTVALGPNKLRNIFWGGDDYVLAEVSVTGYAHWNLNLASELYSLIVVNLKTKTSYAVFERQAGFRPLIAGFYGVRKVGGREVAYVANFPTRDYNALWRVDLETGKPTEVAKAADVHDGHGGWLIDDQGEIVAYEAGNDVKGRWSIVAASGKVLMSGETDLESPGLIALGRQPNTIVVSRYGADKRLRYEEVSLVDGAVRNRLGDDAVEALIGEAGDDRVQGLVRLGPDGRVNRTYFDADLNMKAAKIARVFEPNASHIVSMDAERRRAVVFVQGPTEPGRYWLVDLTTMKGDPIADAYPAIPPQAVAASRLISFTARDGIMLEAVLTLPVDRDPRGLPAIVLPHGGPEARDLPGFDWMAQAFASRGYAVIQPNFRGSASGDHNLRDAGFGQWGRKMQTDVSDALAAVAAQGMVDPRRACIVGGSYGGYVAMAGVTLQHGLYRCAVSWGGVSDLPDFLGDASLRSGSKSGATRYWKRFMGVDEAGGLSGSDRELIASLSPARLADRADAPILLMHGRNDTVVPLAQSQRMAEALRRAGKPYVLTLVDGEDHWLSGEATRIKFITDAVAFVEKYNPPN